MTTDITRDRVHPRYLVDLKVTMKWRRNLHSLPVFDVGLGGLFIETDDPPALRELVSLSFEIPGRATPLQAHGMAVNVAEFEGDDGRPRGVGVQFYAMDRDTQRAWAQFVDQVRRGVIAPPPPRPPRVAAKKQPPASRELPVIPTPAVKPQPLKPATPELVIAKPAPPPPPAPPKTAAAPAPAKPPLAPPKPAAAAAKPSPTKASLPPPPPAATRHAMMPPAPPVRVVMNSVPPPPRSVAAPPAAPSESPPESAGRPTRHLGPSSPRNVAVKSVAPAVKPDEKLASHFEPWPSAVQVQVQQPWSKPPPEEEMEHLFDAFGYAGSFHPDAPEDLFGEPAPDFRLSAPAWEVAGDDDVENIDDADLFEVEPDDQTQANMFAAGSEAASDFRLSLPPWETEEPRRRSSRPARPMDRFSFSP